MIMAVWLAVATGSRAQQGLNIAPLFEGKIVPQERLVETRVRGRMLSKYQLSFFRSVRFMATDQELRQVTALIALDERQNEGAQSTVRRSGKTLMIQLPGRDGHNRYLCYKNKGKEVTVVYMEGALRSLDTLMKILK